MGTKKQLRETIDELHHTITMLRSSYCDAGDELIDQKRKNAKLAKELVKACRQLRAATHGSSHEMQYAKDAVSQIYGENK